MRQMILTRGILPIGALIMISGCESQDQRLVDYAQQATEQQARQNEAISKQSEQVARQSQELASAAHDLLEQDAAARRELIEAHNQAQQQLSARHDAIDQQRRELHVERREAAQAAIRDPVIAQALIVTGLVLATLLPLLVTAYALRRLPDPSVTEALLSNALLEELAALPAGLAHPEQPQALPPDAAAPRLSGPEQSADPGPASSANPPT